MSLTKVNGAAADALQATMSAEGSHLLALYHLATADSLHPYRKTTAGSEAFSWTSLTPGLQLHQETYGILLGLLIEWLVAISRKGVSMLPMVQLWHIHTCSTQLTLLHMSFHQVNVLQELPTLAVLSLFCQINLGMALPTPETEVQPSRQATGSKWHQQANI